MVPILVELWPTEPLRRLRAAVDRGDMRAAELELDALRRHAARQLAAMLAVSLVLAAAGWGLLH